MKNEHFGDVTDYPKYGLLRLLASSQEPNSSPYKVGVCWMLTENDELTSHSQIDYLQKPNLWQRYDPPLFDQLQQWALTATQRSVMLAQNSPLFPNIKFYSAPLTNALRDRVAYFKRMRSWFMDCDLIFYDANNGIEVPSCPKGRQRSAHYIYWDELQATYAAGQSVLVSQRFRRERRSDFIQQLAQAYQTHLGAAQVYWLCTKHQTYFLNAQPAHLPLLTAQMQTIATRWANQMQVGGSSP